MKSPTFVCWIGAISMIHVMFSLHIKCNESCWRLLIRLWLNISKYQWCEGVYIYFDLNDLYWFYLELYDLKASKLRHVIFASLSPTSLTTSYLCWKCLSDICIIDIWTHEYIYIKKSISFLEGNLVSVFGISAFD